MVRTNQPPRGGPYHSLPQCGCWFPVSSPEGYQRARKEFLPLVDLKSHTKILSTTTRTTIHQTFINPKPKKLDEVRYTFPLFDGVSVIGFKCTVESTTLVGVVKEKQQARTDYKEAVARGETAGLLEQLSDASDVFTTKIGNVPANQKVQVEITYLGELHHDSETDSQRFVIPTAIAPRYGTQSFDAQQTGTDPAAIAKNGISISVDIVLEEASIIRQLQSPSHPLAVTIGRTPDMREEEYKTNCAFATLALNSTELGNDFVLVISSKEQGTPQAMLESHPTLPNQRAIMATLVPKFNLPNIVPEIVFVVDRSGSMSGKIATLVSSLKVFLKSLPVNGVKFNICSFGSNFSFLFKKSRTYDQSSLVEAMDHLKTFGSDFGGTEMLAPIKQTCQQRFKDMPLQVMVLTDGEIWEQQELFDFINSQENARFFALGIGSGASTALVQGIARAGGGFAQFVAENETMDKKVVRMLKGALMPHVDYSVELQYNGSDDEDFEMIGSTGQSNIDAEKPVGDKKPISLYDTDAKEEPTNPPASRYDGLPFVTSPKVVQAPQHIPALYPFNRTNVYLLLDHRISSTPKSLKLSGTSSAGSLELTIPIQDVGNGSTIHQLAAKKAIQELEEGRGWLTTVEGPDNKLLKASNEGRWDLIVERECVRLGTTFGVAGKFTSFVAVKERQDSAECQDVEQFELVEETALEEAKLSRARGGGGGVFAAMAAPKSGLFSSFGTSSKSASHSAPGGALFGAVSRLSQSAMPQSFIGRAPAPRKQLASRAARKSAPSPADVRIDLSADYPDDADETIDGSPDQDKCFALCDDEGAASTSATSAKKPTQVTDEQRMHQIINMQTFEGCWADSDKLWKLLGVEKQDVAQKLPQQLDGGDTALATIAVIMWLQAKMQNEEEVWEMIVDKAKAWLRGPGKVDDVDTVLDAVKQCF